MKQTFDTLSEATGVNFSDIMKANTYDAKVNRNVNVTGMSGNIATEEKAESKPDLKIKDAKSE